MNFPQLKSAFRQMYERFKPTYVLVEDATSGRDLIAEIKDTTRIPILPIKVDRDKIARVHAVTPILKSGHVYIPNEASWIEDWEYEHEIFPGGANDDWVDTTTQFPNWARTIDFAVPKLSAIGIEQKSR